MELKSFLTPLLKWWWMLVLCTAVAVGSTYWFTRNLPPVYQASTTLVIGNVLSNATGGDIAQAQQLAGLYATVAQEDTVREAARAALQLPDLPQYDVRLVGNGIFIEIAVTDTDPRLAQLVANELAHQLILKSPSSQQAGSARLAFVNQQLDALEAEITQTQADIVAKQAEISKATGASEISTLQADLTALQDKFTNLQTAYANLMANTPQSYTNVISVAEPASLPLAPIGPNKRLLLLVAAACGFVLAAGTAYLLEFLDDTPKTPEEISQIFQSPLIGIVPVLGKKWVSGLYVTAQPRAPGTEAFRSLRTNLEFAGVDQPLKTILVTSTGAGEGKSTVAVNLALAIAQSGKHVVLVDSDLRFPTTHTFFSIPDHPGLSDILGGLVGLMDAAQLSEEGGIHVIPAGNPAPNPAELLGSKKMEHILASLQETFDVVVLDGPPFLVTDAWILSAKVDGVVLVAQPGRTSKHAARGMMDQIKRGRARLLGIVANRVQRRGSDYYHNSYYRPEPEGGNGHRRGEVDSAAAKGSQRSWLRLGPRFTKLARGAPSEKDGDQVEAPTRLADRVAAERSRKALDVFSAISRELTAPCGQPELLKRLLQLSLEGVGASSGGIAIVGEDGQVTCGAVAYAGKVYVPAPQQLAETVQHGLAGWVIENREAVLISSTRDDPRWLARDWDQGKNPSRSAISVPLVVDKRVFGVLTLVHPRVGQFNEDDLTLLRTVGACISFNPQALTAPAAPLTKDPSPLN
jgi:capsular exopolysaccharide synthesis family protein